MIKGQINSPIKNPVKTSEPLFFAASFLFCALLYLPAINGQPIWDDLAYWIYSPDMKVSFWSLWSFSWPLSVAAQKLILGLFGEHYVFYHLINLGLHFANSFLVYRVARRLAWPRPLWIFLLFLFHPANVISVAWMIQIKTLLCFLFTLVSFFFFDRGLRGSKWMLLALLFFILALLSKSSAVTVPLLFFIYASGKVSLKKWLWAIPLFALSLFAAYLMLTRSLTTSGENAAAPVQKTLIDGPLILQTSKYYFWHTILPLENSPIKGRAPQAIQFFDTAHLVFAAAVLFFFWGAPIAWYLIGGYILLIPFFGFVYAPYMSFTWVSDQHLYLALPVFLTFWMMLLEKVTPRVSNVICGAVLIFFVFKTAQATRFFANEDVFYSESLRADPGNVIAAFNYATTMAYHDKTDHALEIANSIHEMALRDPDIKSQKHFDELEALRKKLIEFQIYKKQKNH